MKKRILFILMLFTITITNAQQAAGVQFTVGDMIYEVNADNTTVSVHNAVTPTTLTGAIIVPTHISDGSFSYTITLIKSAAYNDEGDITSLVVQGDTEIQLQGFRNCYKLASIDLSAIVTKKIGNSAFLNCTGLTSVNFANVNNIGTLIFKGCTNLVTFTGEDLVTSTTQMFQNCTKLETVSFPKLVTAGKWMFQNCQLLENVSLPKLVTIGIQSFVDCKALATIDLPELITIGNLGFYKCIALKNVNLPKLKNINTGAFNSCSALEVLVLPTSVDGLAPTSTNIFSGCTSLTHIAFGNGIPESTAQNFSTLPANKTLIVPAGTSAAFEAEANWTDFSIVEGTLSKTTSDITFSRNLGVDDDWYLVSSPVNDEMFNNAYVTANSIDATGGVATNNAIAAYTTNGNTWDYMEDGEDLPFTPGVGYSVKREDAAGAGNISFTGTSLNSSDITGVPVSLDSDGYNLLGSPFLTNINSGAFLTANANLAGEIWLYDQATGNYDNHVTGDNKVLAPGQGFFVKATSGATVDFTYATIYTAASTGVFQKTAISKIKLLINSGETERFAKLYFTEAATAGFDKGWDGEIFTGVANNFDVFTQLLEGNVGKNYQIQSLSDTSLETALVPVGLISEAGKQITFSAETLNLPTDLKVFLEDRQTNTFTRLDEANSKYEVTLSENLNGVGRFFIHTSTNSVLSIDSTILEGVSVYKSNASTLRVVGLSQGFTTVKLFNVLGKQMMKTSFDASGSDEISLSSLATGIYIVQLETENGKLNKKIILE